MPRRVDLVDLAVRRRADVDAAAGRRRDRVDLELVGVEEHRAAARGVDPVDLAFVAAAGVERAVRRVDDRPEERRARVVDGGRGRAERQPAEGVDREVLDLAAQELALGRDLPERRERSVTVTAVDADESQEGDEKRSRFILRAAASACASR